MGRGDARVIGEHEFLIFQHNGKRILEESVPIRLRIGKIRRHIDAGGNHHKEQHGKP